MVRLNDVRVMRGVPYRVWFNNPAARKGFWLVRPDGVMHWADAAAVAALPVAAAALAKNAFPAADPVAA